MLKIFLSQFSWGQWGKHFKFLKVTLKSIAYIELLSWHLNKLRFEK